MVIQWFGSPRRAAARERNSNHLSKDAAEDIAQETFIKVMNTKDPQLSGGQPFDPNRDTKFSTFLFTIDFWRRKGRVRVTVFTNLGGVRKDAEEDLGQFEANLEGTEPSPDDILLAKERRHEFAECLEQLNRRDAFVLWVWLICDGQTKGLGKLIGCSKSQAWKIREKVFTKVRHCFEEKRLLQEHFSDVLQECQVEIDKGNGIRKLLSARQPASERDELIRDIMRLQAIEEEFGCQTASVKKKDLQEKYSEEELQNLFKTKKLAIIDHIDRRVEECSAEVRNIRNGFPALSKIAGATAKNRLIEIFLEFQDLVDLYRRKLGQLIVQLTISPKGGCDDG